MRRFFRRLAALFHRRRLQQELAEEMAAHRDMMPPDRRRHFGSTLRFQEQAADYWGWTWLDHLRQDLAYAARQFRRAPAFTLTAIAVLSLGIGVNLAEAHIFNAVFHRWQLHVPDVDSLCRFYRVDPKGRRSGFSLPDVEFYRRFNTVLSAVLAEAGMPEVYLADDSKALRANAVSGNYFGELGIAPAYGRLLDEQDDRPGSPPVAVLSYDFWQNRFGADPGIVMTTIRLNQKPVRVVGIAPPQFGGLGGFPNLWMPLSQYAEVTGSGRLLLNYPITSMFGRLKPGISRQAAQAQFRSLTAELRKQQPDHVEAKEWLKVEPAGGLPVSFSSQDLLVPVTFILLVLLVLFSACANLGNMLLARGLARRREVEIRLALGAGRWRLIRQLMTENLLLAALAAIAALAVGKLAALLVMRIIGYSVRLRIVTDWRIVLAAVALALGATLAFGLAPAMQVVHGGPRATRARRILVAIQVAASCVLLILSSFFTRSVQQTLHTAAGFNYSGMALVDPGYYLHNYTRSAAWQASLDLAARLHQIPGIEAASVVSNPPLRRPLVQYFSGWQLYLNLVDPSYFPMMRLPVLLGHIFGPDEPDAVVVSRSAALKLWPNQSPLGKTIRLALLQRTLTVVGVVKDSGANLIQYPESVEVYGPITAPTALFATILVRAHDDPAPLLATLRSAGATSRNVPLVIPYRDLVDEWLGAQRKMVMIVGSLGAVTSLLALIGIFGLLAFTVAQRTREIGVRMALGARGQDILRIVLGQYAVPFGAGTASGIAVAAAAAWVIRSSSRGYSPLDLLSVTAGLLLFAAVALAAAIAPARRALRIDPASALRYE